jgi:hypothetical protein
MARGYGEREPIGGLASIEIIGGARALLPMEVYAYDYMCSTVGLIARFDLFSLK